MLVWDVTTSSVSYIPITSSMPSSFLSDKLTVVRRLGAEEEERSEGEGEESEELGSDDISAMFSHRGMQGENGIFFVYDLSSACMASLPHKSHM